MGYPDEKDKSRHISATTHDIRIIKMYLKKKESENKPRSF